MFIRLNERYAAPFVSSSELASLSGAALDAARSLSEGSCPGREFTGWLELPRLYDREEFSHILETAAEIRAHSRILVVVGIGGSYLGARAAIELLRSPLYTLSPGNDPLILFAGCNLSGGYLARILELCREQDFSVNVVSKSGTTTEPALAFRSLHALLVEKYGAQGAAKRIFCTTDRSRGALKAFADREGWRTFVVPDNIGGRYSVLTAVGLLPIATAGLDAGAMLAGAQDAMQELAGGGFSENPCLRYAAYRNLFYQKGKSTEIFACYEPAFAMTGEWLKQLFGESEGKNGKGLFPAYAGFSTDLHSMGQYIQDGPRSLFETVIDLGSPQRDCAVAADPENPDGLEFLAGRALSSINRRTMEGVLLAHVHGGVPNLVLEFPHMDARAFGYMVYFFEKACAVSGLMLGVNPFNQPGVEEYKRNLFALLGKPGYESLREDLEAQLRSESL